LLPLQGFQETFDFLQLLLFLFICVLENSARIAPVLLFELDLLYDLSSSLQEFSRFIKLRQVQIYRPERQKIWERMFPDMTENFILWNVTSSHP